MLGCDGYTLVGTALLFLAAGMVLLAFLWALADERREQKWRKLR